MFFFEENFLKNFSVKESFREMDVSSSKAKKEILDELKKLNCFLEFLLGFSTKLNFTSKKSRKSLL